MWSIKITNLPPQATKQNLWRIKICYVQKKKKIKIRIFEGRKFSKKNKHTLDIHPSCALKKKKKEN